MLIHRQGTRGFDPECHCEVATILEHVRGELVNLLLLKRAIGVNGRFELIAVCDVNSPERLHQQNQCVVFQKCT